MDLYCAACLGAAVKSPAGASCLAQEIMTYSSVDSFYVSDGTLSTSPSRKDGVEENTELMLRRFGCDLIQQGGILLRLPQAVMATGQVLLQRFYCKESLAKFDVRKMAPASLWLAMKIEESRRRVRDLVNVFHRMRCRRDNLDVSGLSTARYEELKKELLDMELHMLRELGFVCHVEHPHKFVLSYLLSLDATHEFLQEAWSLTNDSLRTTLCVQFKSEVVACGVVYAAARRCKVALPLNPPWWKVFGAEDHQLVAVCKVLAQLYRQPKSDFIEVNQRSNPPSLSVQPRSAALVPVDGPRPNADGEADEVASVAVPVRLRLTGDPVRISYSENSKGSHEESSNFRDEGRTFEDAEEAVKVVRGTDGASASLRCEQPLGDGRSRSTGHAVNISTPEAVNSASAVLDSGRGSSRSAEREAAGRGEERQGRGEERQGRRDSCKQSSSEIADQSRWERKDCAKDLQVRDHRKRPREVEGRERRNGREGDQKYDQSRMQGRNHACKKELKYHTEKKFRIEASDFAVESCRVSHLRTTKELSHRAYHEVTGVSIRRREH